MQKWIIIGLHSSSHQLFLAKTARHSAIKMVDKNNEGEHRAEIA